MRFSSIVTLLLSLALSVSMGFAMSVKPKLPESKWDPALQGIKLGSKYDEVIAALGKPQSRSGNDKNFLLIYEGLTIKIDRTNNNTLWVTSVEITAPKWEIIPKVKVGMPREDVFKTLGTPLHQEEREGAQTWVWWWHESPRFDSLFSVTFENEKAVKIMFSEDKSI